MPKITDIRMMREAIIQNFAKKKPRTLEWCTIIINMFYSLYVQISRSIDDIP